AGRPHTVAAPPARPRPAATALGRATTMIDFACPSCREHLSAPDDYAGKRIRCGGCQSVATVPMTSEAAREPPPLRERPPERDYSDEPPRRRRDRYNDDYDDRPRRSLRRRSQWADCPNCGAHDPAKVSYTWWGGFIGPAIINVVRCQEC